MARLRRSRYWFPPALPSTSPWLTRIRRSWRRRKRLRKLAVRGLSSEPPLIEAIRGEIQNLERRRKKVSESPRPPR
jgi:hypothetical protein